MTRTLVVDADIVTYQSSAAGEQRSIRVIHKKTGREKVFKSRTEFYGRDKARSGGWLGERNADTEFKYEVDDFDIIDVQTPEPISFVISNMKRTIDNAMQASGCDKVRLLMGAGETFRDKIAVPAKDLDNPLASKYKGNRIGGMRPVHLKAAREYLLSYKNAELIDYGIECDDAISIIAAEGHQYYLESGNTLDNPYVIHYYEKDFLANSKGWVYEPHNEPRVRYLGKDDDFGFVYLNKSKDVKGEGLIFKYYQLNGEDAADNYKARDFPTTNKKKYGKQSIYQDLIQCKTEKDLLELTIKNFKEFVPEPHTYTSCFGTTETDDWKSWLEKHARFVAMLTREPVNGMPHPEDFWDILGLCDKYGVEY